ncbi:DUF2232 domain-containing protein [Limisalsivibrio acetivorans]|uniref:DUF2232 domain-containing protein n=1 Tax=Limisalsivibrio acetivorans TaxID=1304888 RepID=UPI0003B66CBE|nr:DUF2232 domain-containing protein [Limisalsivibrio acetivorans]
MSIIYLPLASLALFGANIFYPSMGILLSLFAPLLLLLYLVDERREKLSDIISATALIVSAYFFPIMAGYYAVMVLFTAYFILYCNRNNLYPNWLPVAGSPIPIFLVAAFVVYLLPDSRDMLIDIVKQLLTNMTEAVKQSPNNEVPEHYIAVLEQNIDQAARSAVFIFPGLNYSFVSLIAYFTMNFFLKMKKSEHIPFRLPDNAVWIMIAGVACFFIGGEIPRSIGMNTLLIFTSLYFFQGFEIVRFWLGRFNVFPLIKAILYILIFSQFTLIILIALQGLFSIWLNMYPRPEEEKTEED